jgi:hypothetical protein
MITVDFQGKRIKIDGVVNREDWGVTWWLVLLGTGFDPARILVRADNETDVIDLVTDSPTWKHLLREEEECPHGDDVDHCDCEFAGNFGERIDSNQLSYIGQAKRINFFDGSDRYSVG